MHLFRILISRVQNGYFYNEYTDRRELSEAVFKAYKCCLEDIAINVILVVVLG